MFFFDIILAMFLQLALVFGETGAIIVLIVGGLAVAGLGWWGLSHFTESLVSSGSGGGSVSQSPRTRFAGLSGDALQRHIERNPQDAIALREKIRRERTSANPSELAEQIESLLAMRPKLELEDLAMLHHQLADLYCGPLAQRLRATQVLASFADSHPDSREAQFMRDKIKQIGELEAQ